MLFADLEAIWCCSGSDFCDEALVSVLFQKQSDALFQKQSDVLVSETIWSCYAKMSDTHYYIIRFLSELMLIL
jgi:hypothetical protein